MGHEGWLRYDNKNRVRFGPVFLFMAAGTYVSR
jgi:hypothetical protein